MARGGRSTSEEQKTRPRRAERVAGWGEETQKNLDRRAREEKSGSVLRGAAEAVRREDHGDRGEAGPEEERGESVVLQPAAETEAHEVRGAALTGGRRRGSAVPRPRVRLLSAPLRAPRPGTPHTTPHSNKDLIPISILNSLRVNNLVFSVDIIPFLSLSKHVLRFLICMIIFRHTGYIIIDYIHITTAVSRKYRFNGLVCARRLDKFSEHRICT